MARSSEIFIEDYLEALASGRTNGYGFLESLSESQIKTLCDIANRTDKSISCHSIKDLQEFTKEHSAINDRIFDDYIERVIDAREDLRM